MSNIGIHHDYDDQFFRMITISVAKTLSRNIRLINKFEPEDETKTGMYRFFLPFYTSLTGSERFVLDAFVDDVVDKRVNVNTDQHQRGSIIFTGFNSRSDESANPNQYLSKKEEINGTIRKVISKVKSVPVTVNFDIEIQLATMNEIDKVSQKLMNIFYNYQFFNFDYYGLKVDAFFNLPDDKSIEIQREIAMDTDKKKFIKFSIEVQSYYPIFMIDSDDLYVCDNDDDINWDNLEIPRPSLNYNKSIRNYNEAYGQTTNSGGTTLDENLHVEGMTEIRRVYWTNMYKELQDFTKEKDSDWEPEQWNKEDFDGVDPGKSSKQNDNDLDDDE
jgi:hypothetical protein